MPSAFVLIPFEDEFNTIYEQLIRPALEDAGYDVARADSFADQRNILIDIVQGITTADLVVAEITTANPNVFYELGIAHGLLRPTVLLSQSIDAVPFDLRSYRVVTYSTHFSEVGQLQEHLATIGRRHVNGELRFGSPVTDFANQPSPDARSGDQNGDRVAAATTDQLPADAVDDGGEPGFLEQRVMFEETTGRVGRHFEEMTDLNTRVTAVFEEVSVETNAAAQQSGPGSGRRMLVLAGRVASALNEYAREVDEITPAFEQDVAQLVSIIETAFSVSSEEDFASAEAAIESARGLKASTRENIESVSGVRGHMREFATLHVTREMTRAAGRAGAALDRYLSVLEQLEAFADRSVAVIELRMQEYRERTSDEAQTDAPDEAE